jgi:hypothetical protein
MPVNDLFAQPTLFPVVQKTTEKSAGYLRAQAPRDPRGSFEGRNLVNLSIRLTGFKP